MINGTTLCIHCQTRFKISKAQLAAHHGMVRCGHCLQAFDARPNFIADQPDGAMHDHEVSNTQAAVPDSENVDGVRSDGVSVTKTGRASGEGRESFVRLWLNRVRQVRKNATHNRAAPHTGIWVSAILVLSLLLIAQIAYFFRISLAAHLPTLKPALVSYCHVLKCEVPLPQNMDLMSMESSSLDADPVQVNQITLNALLRNRGSYTLAYPVLALTLNDSQDRPLSRRLFKPSEYLPSGETEQAGLQSNREVSVKLRLRVAALRPSGYRLELFYERND